MVISRRRLCLTNEFAHALLHFDIYDFVHSTLRQLGGLKSLLHQGLSEPEFYGDLVYKFKRIRGMTDFSDQFRKIIMRYRRIGYNLNVM